MNATTKAIIFGTTLTLAASLHWCETSWYNRKRTAAVDEFLEANPPKK